MSSRDQASGIRRQGRPSRREFLRAAGLAMVAPLVPLRPEAKLGRIGIQLYTLRRQFAQNPEGTLARVAEIGYREVEFAGYPPGTPQAVRAMLERQGLRAPSSHVGLAAVRSGWEQTLEQAAVIGQQYIVVPSIPQSERRGVDGWKRIAAAFNQAGATARAQGIRFCYHNHDFEFPPLDGAVPYDLLLAETDPKLVGFEMDLYWITKAGKNPLDYFAKWPGRFPLVHVKDMDSTPRQSFTEVGKGSIDFAGVFRRAKQAGIRHYFYEQDETPGDPFESARLSYGYLKSLSF